MSIASRVVSAGSVSDIGGLAEFWLAELQWVVDSWVDSGNRVVDVDNTSSLLVLSKIESVYLLCHLLDLALGIGAVDYSSLVKCQWECVNILNRDKQRVAIGAYLPLVNLAGIVCARNELDKDSAELALDIARNVVKQMKYLQPASAAESALALMFCLAKKTPRLEIESCVSDMLDVAVSALGFRHKLLKISVGRFMLVLLAENPRIYNGLVDATYTLLGDDSSEVRNAWSQVASMLDNMSLLSSGYISGAVETTPITAYLRNTRLFRASNAFGERDVDECACALSMEDALAIICGVVDSSKYSAADLVADIGLSQLAIQATTSLAAIASDVLQLSVEKTYSLASVPTASERDRLAAVRQAFIRGDACPSRVLELLRNWVHVEHLDNYGVREWWETYTCSAISAAFNSRLVGLESSADAAHQWISLESVGAAVEKVSSCDRLDMLFARKPCVDMPSAIVEASVFMQTHCSGNCDINIAAAADDGVYTIKAKEALLYLGSDDKVPDVTTNKLFTDLLMNGTGKIRSTATGMFDPASLLVSRMATSPTKTPVLLSDTLNHNAQTQLAPFIPQLFAMLCYNHSSSRGSDTSKINGALVNDSALRILQLLAQSAPELLVFYTVVTSKSLPKTSRGGQLVSQLLGLFDSATVADIHLFLSLAGSVAVLPQEQLRRACIKAKTAHHRAVTTLVQSTGVDLQAAVDEALGPVYRIISEYSDKEMAQSPIEAEFIAKVPRLKMLVDQLSCSSIDMADISNCLRGFEAVWTEIFKTASTASSLAVGQISPRLLGFRAPIPIPSLTNPTEPLYFAQIGSAVRVIGSKTRPKLISLHLANRFGEISRHKYILKGSEDLRIDECVMQTFVRLNRVLDNGNGDGEQGRSGRLAVYNVVPIDTYGGLLQVVDNAPSLFHLYSKQAALIQGMGTPRLSNNNNQQTLQQPVVVPAGFHQVYMAHAQQVLCQFGLPSTLPMGKWPQHVYVAVYELLTTDGGSVNSSSLLYNHLLRAAQSSSHLLLTMRNMVRSIGIASIAGYIVGLGDRHLDNLLVDANVGQLVHVDFNVCFDFGSVSQIPEQVPFRMSPALSYLCGTAPIPGSNRHMESSEQGAFSFSRVFESAARTVLKLARMDRRCLVDAITSRSLFRPFMEWCWMEETRHRGQRKMGNKQQRGAVLSPIISPASGSFAFAQPENSNNADTDAGAAVQNTGSAGSSSLLLLRPPPSLSEKVVDQVWNQNCETMQTDEFVRATGLCPPNGFWPRRRFAVSARSEEAQMDNEMVVNSITEIPYGWRIAYEARDRVDARLAYNGGNGERDDDELVSEQIRVLWQAATCKDRLSRMFMGWAPWV
ncbi:Serine/threonine-protein kinase smg1 [Coemansia sp. RSA 1722]|nr:Serine/threonine-protein kinase smg1 [Coemansia sp. RSA 1722]